MPSHSRTTSTTTGRTDAGPAASRRWTPARVAGALGLFGFAASLWIHAVAAMLGVLFAWFSPGGGGVSTGIGTGERGIALGPASSLSELAGGEDSGPASLLDKPLDTAGADASLADVMGQIADPTEASEGGSTGISGGAGDPSLFTGTGGGGGGAGGSGLEGSGGGGSAKFFGVEARGKRFAYICDVSGSMVDERLTALKRELQASVNELSPGSQFAIILFSTDARTLTGEGWMEAGPAAREQIKKLLRGVEAFGGTEPLPAFGAAFSMRPRPDAIYFMTDGEFAQGQEPAAVARIQQLNASGNRPSPIHCITFMERGGEKIMRMIAKGSGGVYRHIGGTAPLPAPSTPAAPGSGP